MFIVGLAFFLGLMSTAIGVLVTFVAFADESFELIPVGLGLIFGGFTMFVIHKGIDLLDDIKRRVLPIRAMQEEQAKLAKTQNALLTVLAKRLAPEELANLITNGDVEFEGADVDWANASLGLSDNQLADDGILHPSS